MCSERPPYSEYNKKSAVEVIKYIANTDLISAVILKRRDKQT